MYKCRVIPCLLLKDSGLVKTRKFSKPTYLGDPINAVKIFNEKEVDELIFLDITASRESREPDYPLIQSIAEECFMPFAYGGGIHSLDTIKKLLRLGVEKIVINSACFENPAFVKKATETYGNSTIVASVDIKKNLWGKYQPFIRSGTISIKTNYLQYLKNLEELGVGEIFLNFIDRDGEMSGFDSETIKTVVDSVEVPVIACGGAGSLMHIKELQELSNISAVAAGSLFVYQGNTKGILINYPTRTELDMLLSGP